MNKKKSNVLYVKKMKQVSRLESAKHWLHTYTFKEFMEQREVLIIDKLKKILI